MLRKLRTAIALGIAPWLITPERVSDMDKLCAEGLARFNSMRPDAR
jgi:hypothetical protein